MAPSEEEPPTITLNEDKIEFIDSHAHLLWPTLLHKIDQIISAAEKNHVYRIINIGINYDDLIACLNLQEKFNNVFNVVGLHPEESIKANANWELFKAALFRYTKKFVGIGEIGLDYWETKDLTLRKRQEEFFRRQLDLAQELQKPVVIHCRNAEKQAIKILLESRYQDIPGVLLHCFGGAQKYLDIALTQDNWMFTVPTSVVYKKIHRILAMKVPLGRILLETDSPFLKPYSSLLHNSPQYVVYAAQEIAYLKEISLEDVAFQTTINSEKFFSLPSRSSRIK
ncbi:MAG: TatD family hydrolase [Candidatus Lokiarchaeota archaeon]|nr:TatD family hydrolase [Candidatus Harpocratesius repetitus]